MPACGIVVVSYTSRKKLDRFNGFNSTFNAFGQVSVPMASTAVLGNSPVADPQNVMSKLLFLTLLQHCTNGTLTRICEHGGVQVGLLAEASANAKRAARAARGSLMTKLQAYRIWIVTEYMHEVIALDTLLVGCLDFRYIGTYSRLLQR